MTTDAAERLGVDAVAAVLVTRGGRFALEPVRIGEIRGDEVLVEIVATGICHTDLAVRDQRRAVPLPAVLGHEGAGIVRRVGDDVRSVAIGDHVVLSYMSCGACRECVRGETASCRSLGPLCFARARADGSHAITPLDNRELSDRFFGQSAFATWAVATARNVVPVPRDVPLEIMGPLGCGVMTGAGAVWNVLAVAPGDALVVFGAGGVGLSAILAARSTGVRTIVAVDRVSSRLNLARELGATDVIDASVVTDVAGAIRERSRGGVDHALDTTGAPAVALAAFRSLRQRGTLAIAATVSPTQDLVIPQLELMTGCRRIVGVIEGGGNGRHTIDRVIKEYRAGRFPFDRLITFYDFGEINRAVEDCESGRTIKPVLRMPAAAQGNPSTA